MRTLVSKKSPLIGLVPVEDEVRRDPTAQFAETFQEIGPARLSPHGEVPGAVDVDLDLVAGPELKGFRDSGRDADGETVAPFGDLHGRASGYTVIALYIRTAAGSMDRPGLKLRSPNSH